ncbi:MAG: DUF4325 domain-containing protein [Actinomycetota bacterium]
MDLKKLIIGSLNKNGKVTASEIVKKTGFSRVYVNRFFRQLRDEGKIALIGKANRAYYVLVSEEKAAKEDIRDIRILEKTKNLVEHDVLRRVKRETGILSSMKENVRINIEYAFAEMLNNAIEHSKSEDVHISMTRSESVISFVVRDWGVGVFNNIMQKKHLRSETEAVQDLLKGKQTTAPEAHSGEGIFFTSKVADKLTFVSSDKRLIFDNIIDDVFLEHAKENKGTKVTFMLTLDSNRDLTEIFQTYTNDSYEFSKTVVNVKLYKTDVEYISRSQARRILSGLEKFKKVVLDFKDVKTVGQAFADEIFRIWKQNHPNIEIIAINMNENVDFMIKHALSQQTY